MLKLWASTYKELLLLVRDVGGLAILFLMPLLLVITITLVQNETFKTLKESKITILVVDNDKGEVSQDILKNLTNSSHLEVQLQASETQVKQLVRTGKYQLGIVIPINLSHDLNQKVAENVEVILEKFGEEEESIPMVKSKLKPKEIRLYFDPATQFAFRSSIKSGIDQMVSKIESQTIYNAFQEELTDDPTEEIFDTEPFLVFKEIVPTNRKGSDHSQFHPAQYPGMDALCHFLYHSAFIYQHGKRKKSGNFRPIAYPTGRDMQRS